MEVEVETYIRHCIFIETNVLFSMICNHCVIGPYNAYLRWDKWMDRISCGVSESNIGSFIYVWELNSRIIELHWKNFLFTLIH